MPKVIGLTGSTGVGKTAVASKLKTLGCEVADADLIARNILIAGAAELREGHPHWFEAGKLSSRLIADDVFTHRDSYNDLCSYLWPRTQARAREMIEASSSEYFVYDAPLLFEAGSERICDLTLLVTADDNVRKRRALARSGWTSEQYDQRQGLQLSQQEKAGRATLRLHNDGTLEELEARTEQLFKTLVPHVLESKSYGSSIGTLDDAWLFANRWWLADSLRHRVAFHTIKTAMQARGGYHSVSHLDRMTAKYREWCDATGNRALPRLATWIFAHDLVYSPGAADNETSSAREMDRLLQEMSAYRRIGKDDLIAIESTRSHEPVREEQLEDANLVASVHLLHDLDLEILGSNVKEYGEYRRAVYAEYLAASEVPSAFHALWLQGRKTFLEAMLGRHQIFKTPYFQALEPAARQNMSDELSQIVAELSR
ncbi:MAG TPA: dephospho-CoA kinase [Fimbriimonas sp.]|nr:dephospho-CoA kinase [Fimbriimonas sp.]